MSLIEYSIIATSFLLLLLPLFVYSRRNAGDVLEDLQDIPSELQGTVYLDQQSSGDSELSKAGFLSLAEQKAFRKKQGVIIISLVSLFLCSRTLLGFHSLIGLAVSAIPALALSYLASRSYLSACAKRYQRSIEFHLPIVMERLVMAVESGLDIIPALGAILELDEKRGGTKVSDPLSRILTGVYNLSQSGICFEKALSEAAARSNCSGLRHALLHLGLAQKEGGELMGPLRELSDATQLYYQESIELEIAKMPVKATMPLVLTFAGLIILFLSTPLVQISNITQESLNNTGGIHAEP